MGSTEPPPKWPDRETLWRMSGAEIDALADEIAEWEAAKAPEEGRHRGDWYAEHEAPLDGLDVLTVNQAARFLGRSYDAVWRAVKRGKLPAYDSAVVGSRRRVRLHRLALEAYRRG